MKIDLQEINHNYIIRLVIFSIFMYKRLRDNPKVYEEAVKIFINKRLNSGLDIKIEFPQMSVQDKRNYLVDNILFDDEVGSMDYLYVNFTTQYKEVNLQIDLNDEEKYQLYLYG